MVRPKSGERYMSVEAPTTVAIVEFLSGGSAGHGVSIKAEIVDGHLLIKVDASRGEGRSDSDTQDFDIMLPEVEEEVEEEDA